MQSERVWKKVAGLDVAGVVVAATTSARGAAVIEALAHEDRCGLMQTWPLLGAQSCPSAPSAPQVAGAAKAARAEAPVKVCKLPLDAGTHAYCRTLRQEPKTVVPSARRRAVSPQSPH